MLDQLSDGAGSELAGRAAGRLGEIAAGLRAATAPSEQAFMDMGRALAQAMAMLERLQGAFSDLSARLDGDEANQADAALAEVLRRIVSLSDGTGAAGEGLARLHGIANDVASRLATLDKVLTEVAALATNAKVQAALVSVANMDFSVFTTEISRLHERAQAAIQQAARRLDALRKSIFDARAAAAQFQRRDAVDIAGIRDRLGSSLRSLGERHARSGRAAQAMSGKSKSFADRVGHCVSALQINDITSQRIDHVCKAIDAAAALVAGHDDCALDIAWASSLDPRRRHAIAGAVCGLQNQQLETTAHDFLQEMEALASSLLALAGEAGKVGAEAEALFGGGDAGDSFFRQLGADIERAAGVLGAYAQTEAKIKELVQGVASGFDAMAADIGAIHGIDADLRVMGLNASLKCARLGSAGRALGVVAQELRACSRRAEEHSHAVAEILADALSLSAGMAEGSVGADAGTQSVVRTMSTAMDTLNRLAADTDEALGALRRDGADVASLLRRTAEGVDVHHRLDAALRAQMPGLAEVGASLAGDAGLADEVQEHVHRLLAQQYTMAGERNVHRAFDQGESPADGLADEADIDDMLF